MAIKTHITAAAFILGLISGTAQAKDWGLVVGIDDYRHFKSAAETKSGHTDLEGAVNDARAIARALRSVGVDLPDHRFLLDDRATLGGFRTAWEEITTKASPGDTLIISYAGHGGQEKEIAPPFDEEKDGKDETLMFHDFDPKRPNLGRLNDDQLQEMLAAAGEFNIIWVMDSCHSAGLERSINPRATGLSRNGGVWDIPLDDIPDALPVGSGDADRTALAHVTQILATASEDRVVHETAFDNVKHGALSYFFAKAISGEADQDGDGGITRAELSGYVEDRVFTHMDGKQQPTFLPRGDNRIALSLQSKPAASSVQSKPKANLLRVQIIGAKHPDLASGCPGCVFVDDDADMTFEAAGSGWQVFNATGDLVTTITRDPVRQIRRAQFLRAINTHKNPRIPAVKITPAQSSEARQKIGNQVAWTFEAPSPETPYLTLFNVASDGSVQFGITPASFRLDEPVHRGIRLRFSVAPPPGVDQLVAVFCKRPPLGLQDLLNQMNGRLVPPFAAITEALTTNTCQFGRIGLFTEH